MKSRAVLWLALLGGCTAGARAEQFNRQGEIDLQAGQVDRALQAFDRAIELRPDFAVAHRNRGRALFSKSDPGGAEKALRRALELDPKEAGALMELGRSLVLDQTRGAEGMGLCRQAVEIDPSLALAWGCLCARQGLEGDTQGALETCKKAIDLDPDRTPVLVYAVYGRSLEAAGRLAEAGEAYENGLRLDADTPELHYRLAGIRARSGRPEEALLSLQRAIELKPGYVQAHRSLAEYYIISKDLERARQYVSSARALGAIIPKKLEQEYEALEAQAAASPNAP